MNVKVRLAKPEEFKEVFEVNKRVWLKTYPNKKEGISEKAINKMFSEKGRALKKIKQTKISHTWVAVAGDKIVGICRANILDNNVCYLGATYILPDYQCRGIGRIFLKKAERWFGEGVEIKTEVASYNLGAIEFYKKLGFVKTGRIKKPKNSKFPDGSIIPIFEMTKNKKR